MTREREPLDGEERALAGRLARLSAPGAPSPALDARILAAARAEVGAGAAVGANVSPRATGSAASSRRARAPRRWPVAAGAVATLALAVGLAWQLRPTPGTDAARQDTFHRAAEAPAAGSSAVADMAAAEAAAAPDLPMAVAVLPRQGAARADAAAEREREPPREMREQAPPAPAPPEPDAFPAAAAAGAAAPVRARAQQVPADDAAAAVAPAPAPPPPPAPVAPLPDSSVPAELARQRAVQGVAGDAPAASRNAQAVPAQAKASDDASTELDRIEVTGARIRAPLDDYEEGINDEPPATADSPDVQRAWLQRIHELQAAGSLDAARASLAEFRRRYPQHPIPDDLRALSP